MSTQNYIAATAAFLLASVAVIAPAKAQTTAIGSSSQVSEQTSVNQGIGNQQLSIQYPSGCV